MIVEIDEGRQFEVQEVTFDYAGVPDWHIVIDVLDGKYVGVIHVDPDNLYTVPTATSFWGEDMWQYDRGPRGAALIKIRDAWLIARSK